MPIHPNLRRGSMTPKEKAIELAGQSQGLSEPTIKGDWGNPRIRISNLESNISLVSAIVHSKDLTKEDIDWWKEVLVELQKIYSYFGDVVNFLPLVANSMLLENR